MISLLFFSCLLLYIVDQLSVATPRAVVKSKEETSLSLVTSNASPSSTSLTNKNAPNSSDDDRDKKKKLSSLARACAHLEEQIIKGKLHL